MRERGTREGSFSDLKIPRGQLHSIEFDSAAEYACAVMLERHLNWEAIPAVTFHIPVGRCIFDFRVNNTLIEYHPISLRHEFLTDALHDILSAARFLKRDKRADLLESVADEFKAQYIKRRGQIAAADPQTKSCNLICTFSPEEFVTQALERLSQGTLKPTKDLCAEFRQIVREVSRRRR
jgi:hypothetical protein